MHVQCLIVDDEQALADSTAEYLNLFHVSAHAVYTQESCLAFLKQHTIDILLLDVNLMDASGFLFTKKNKRTVQFSNYFH